MAEYDFNTIRKIFDDIDIDRAAWDLMTDAEKVEYLKRKYEELTDEIAAD